MSGYVNVNGADMGLRFDFSMEMNGQKDVDRAIASLAGALDEKQVKKAIRYARGASLRAGKALGAKLAREEYTARAAAIKNRFITTILNSGEQAAVRFSGFPGLNLFEFLPRPNKPGVRTKQGVSVKVKKAGSRHVPSGKKSGGSKPFVAPIYKNRQELGIFVRYGEKRNMLYGPSPVQALQKVERQEKIRARIADVFERRLVHELDVRLAGIVK